MKQHFQCQVQQLDTAEQTISYRVYSNNYQTNGRRLLLLHGAGVAGEFTWSHMVEHLSHWGEVLVPDLRGMGDTCFPDSIEHGYSAEEIVGDVVSLLDHLGWWACDMGGYSLGGLIGMLLKQLYPARVHKEFLLEPALLDRASMDDVIELRNCYADAAQLLRLEDQAEQGIGLFLDTISPNRIPSPKSEQMITERLAQRALGFANALDSVSDASKRLNRGQLLEDQRHVSCFVGGRSVEAMHSYHQQLSHDRDDWTYHSVKGCDHSLPFQKPRQIARQINADMAQYLDRKPVESISHQ